jgi:hypothetical protein
MNTQRAITIAMAALAIFAIVAGFRLLGTPDRQRRIAQDNERIEDMQSIAVALRRRAAALPKTVPATVERTYTRYYMPGHGSVRTSAYEYRRINARHFQLCAVFLEPADETSVATFAHGAGRTCYRFDLRAGDSTVPLSDAARH